MTKKASAHLRVPLTVDANDMLSEEAAARGFSSKAEFVRYLIEQALPEDKRAIMRGYKWGGARRGKQLPEQ